ncbi:MAG: hypothetical protein ABI352_00770 [Candidatus Dormibacter sp.]
MLEDVEALLDAAIAGWHTLSGEWRQTLYEKKMSPALHVTIKHVLEDQRSALDYTAYAIAEACGKASSKIYYPMAQSAERFPAAMEDRMKGIAAALPTVAEAIERHQPYRQVALRYLSKLTREHKHRRLTRHEWTVRPGTAVVKGGSLGWYGLGWPIWLVDPDSPTPPDGNIETTFVDWYFSDPSVPVLGTLADIQDTVRAALLDIHQAARL